MRHLDLFSGIGGFALAAMMVWGDDYENIGFCDNNAFCQEVLTKNFPGCTIWGDIREVTRERIAADAAGGRRRMGVAANEGTSGGAQHALGDEVDLLTGGFPCQPFSCAGKRAGQSDDRYLWPEMLRVIREFKPRFVLAENVPGIIEMALRQVQADLEAADYEVGLLVIPACAVNAPHRRDRVWIVAHSRRGQQSECGFADEMPSERDSEKRAANPISRPDSPAADGSGERFRGERRDGLERAQSAIQSGSRRPSTDTRSTVMPSPNGEAVKPQSGGSGKDTGFPDWQRDWREVAFATCVHRVDDGLSRRLVRLPSGRTISQSRWRTEALKAFGNAIVPAVAIEIMRAIRLVEQSLLVV